MGEQAQKALAELVEAKRNKADNGKLLALYQRLEAAKKADRAAEKQRAEREAARNS